MFLVFEAIAPNFLDSGFTLAEDGESAHLIGGFAFADFAHGKAHVNEDPVAGLDGVLLEKAEVDFATHTDYLDNGLIVAVGAKCNDSTGDCQAHVLFLLAGCLCRRCS
jgi:hypothetical protein